MALCVVLLVGGGLLVRTMRNLENTPLGMRVDGLVVFGVKPDFKSVPGGVAFYQELIEQIACVAGCGIRDHHGRASRVRMVEQQLHDGRRQDARGGQRQHRRPYAAISSDRTSFKLLACRFLTAATLPIPIPRPRRMWPSSMSSLPNASFPIRTPLVTASVVPTGVIMMTVVGVVKDHKYRSIDEDADPHGLVYVRPDSGDRRDAC